MIETGPFVGALFLVMLGGCFFLACGMDRKAYYLVLAVLSIVLLCYTVYLKSFYGEALILALAPAFCVGIKQLAGRNQVFLYTVCAVLIIYSKQQMVFVAPLVFLLLFRNAWVHREQRPKKIWLSIGLLCAVCVLTLQIYPENKGPNQYNRYFNGLGWSLMNSADWPAYKFENRHIYFYSHKDRLQALIPETLPDHEYIGTLFLPTASKINDVSRDPLSTELQKTEAKRLAEHLISKGSFSNYLITLVKHPDLIIKIVKNTYLTMVRGDYYIDYVRSAANFAPFVKGSRVLEPTKIIITRIIGWVFVFSLLLAFVCRPSWVSGVVAIWMVMAPLAVVAGDGYFEFEKHMTAYVVFLPCALMAMLAVPSGARATADLGAIGPDLCK